MDKTIPLEFENILRTTILKDLELGRKNFDRPHTEAVVFWMKYILNNTRTDLDPCIMIPAAYAHDWGYIGLFEGFDSDDPRHISQKKLLHMDRGAEKLKKLLEDSCRQFVSDRQITSATRLVLMHDKVNELRHEDEFTIMEADTLGMVDVDRVKPTFSKADNESFIEKEIIGWRIPKFIHPDIKLIAETLAKKRLEYGRKYLL